MKNILMISTTAISFCLTTQVLAFDVEKMICKDVAIITSNTDKMMTDSEFELTINHNPLSVSGVLTKKHTHDSFNPIDQNNFNLSNCETDDDDDDNLGFKCGSSEFNPDSIFIIFMLSLKDLDSKDYLNTPGVLTIGMYEKSMYIYGCSYITNR